MRLLLDANVLLDCLVEESNGEPRAGKVASEAVFQMCDDGEHEGLIAWQTLCIISYFYERLHSAEETGEMIDGLLAILEVPTVGSWEASRWRTHGTPDVEDALQVACAVSGHADYIITRNVKDFMASTVPAITPEHFLSGLPV